MEDVIKFKINWGSLITTILGIVVAFWIVEELKIYRAKKGLNQIAGGGGVSVGANVNVAGEPIIDANVGAETGGGRTVVYN
jgi:hypothetical protein